MKLYTIKICISKFNKFKIVNNKNPDSFQACKPRNIKNIEACMKFFLTNPNDVKKFGKAAKTRAIKHFDSNLMSSHWLNFYKRYIY